MKNDTTKQALANALKQLLQKKQITKITINDIAEACGISRMTFYYHFKDIYDLADWTLQEVLHTVQNAIKRRPCTSSGNAFFLLKE